LKLYHYPAVPMVVWAAWLPDNQAVTYRGASMTYAQRIDRARKLVAILFGVCGPGFATCANTGYRLGADILGIGTVASLSAAFGLFVEYVVRARIETRKSGLAPYQFTIAETLVVTAGLALVLGLFRMWGVFAIAAVVLPTVIVACLVEGLRSKHAGSRPDQSSAADHGSQGGRRPAAHAEDSRQPAEKARGQAGG
jgi:hypothetical protein